MSFEYTFLKDQWVNAIIISILPENSCNASERKFVLDDHVPPLPTQIN